MADVGHLGLEVDGTKLVAADRALEHFTQTAANAERAVTPLTTKVDDLGRKGVTSTGSVNQLNNVLRTLTIQATGADPVVGRLVTTVSAFAIGGAVMTGAMAGVAGISLLIRKLGADSRFAAAEGARHLAVLMQLGGMSDVERATRSVGGQLATAVAQLDSLRSGGGTVGGHLGAGYGARHSQEVGTALNRVLLLSALQRRGIEAGYGDQGPTLAQRGSLPSAGASPYAWSDSGAGRLTNGQNFSQGSGNATDVMGVAGRGMEMLERRQRALASAEEELASARERANASLVLGLANVGRAYGGVVDQVLNLAAATLSLERMPMVSGRDKATAYGSAALTGIGYGASGGPFLGAAGGAASGFSMAGPYGAIVGGVSGIVSGLIKQGERAREAARLWQASLGEFEKLFNDAPTAQETNDEWFKGLSGGWTVDEVRSGVARGIGGGTWLAQMRELLKVYDENTQQAKALASAERELYDARFRSLNAPQGFNLAYFGYLAGSSFQAPGGGTNNPRDTLRRGGDPYPQGWR